MKIRILAQGHDGLTWEPNQEGWSSRDADIEVPDDVLESWEAAQGAWYELQRFLHRLRENAHEAAPGVVHLADVLDPGEQVSTVRVQTPVVCGGMAQEGA